MKIGIMGVGSLGTIIGALLTEGGENVDLIDINKAHVEELNSSGAKLTGFVNKTVKVKAFTPDNLTDSYDLVFLLTKQVYNKESLEQLSPHLHAKSIVCTLQNGVPEDLVSSIIGAERTIGGVVGFGATWKGPGVSELTTEWEAVRKYAFDIGEINGELTPRLEKVKAVLEHVGQCNIDSDILGVKWSKLLMNATFSGMSAALGCTFGDVMENKIAMTSLAYIADETIKVAHAKEIRLALMQGKDMEFLELKNHNVNEKMAFYEEVWAPHKSLKASMLQDLEKKIKTEINFINGYVSAMGEDSGVSTPFNDLVVKLVLAAEKEKIVPKMSDNLIHFERLNKEIHIGV
ncbi:2-dehydropantoate 2-reductase [Sporosarcina sp. YIM B06819]|uniref:ketopantoate reductase family protein n=1 Tax=Sporosarcina sp. YIM B06819 TaxID=3081769 RepID=UPI00298CD620|nr:2-dehydropantoate 2-reductase [Sporosarcina sp. YIM B06819]